VVREVVEVSPDGNTMTSSFTFLARTDGKQPTDVFTYKRTGGEGKPYAFIGAWKEDRTLRKWGEAPVPMIITESGGVLTMSNSVTDARTIIDLNKSEVAMTGGNPANDATRTAKKIDERSFEMTFTRGGRTTNSLYRVAADGKTMTLRFTSPGEGGKPVTSTFLYERQ
jgi:hypothetical protein